MIESRDSDESFIYVDPPYIDSNQGHYGGYTAEHFKRDLNALKTIKGKFLLSSYPSEILNDYIKENNWYSIEIDKVISAGNGAMVSERKRKIEVLTANYPIN